MASFKNPFIPSIAIATTLLLLTLTSATANLSNKCSGCGSGSASFTHQVAKDAIYIGGLEVQRAIEFAHAIPKLQTFHSQQDATNNWDGLMTCTGWLENYLTGLQNILDRMKSFKTKPIQSDMDSFREMVAQFEKYGGCDHLADSYTYDMIGQTLLMVDHKVKYIWRISNDLLELFEMFEV